MNYKPWDHQLKLYNQIVENINNGIRSQIGQLPTRGGKSWIAAKLIEDYSVHKKMTVYFVAHTKILIDQMSSDCKEHGINHGVIAPWAPQVRYRAQVISKDSLVRRLQKMKESGWAEPSLIIVDECHLSMGQTYKKILEEFPNSFIVGLTATPTRLDGKGLGKIYDKLVIGPSINELQEKNILCKVDTFIVEFDETGIRKSHGDYNMGDAETALDKPAVLSDIVEHWKKIAPGKKTLAFCVSINHAEHLTNQFISNGISAISISSKDGKTEIEKKLSGFYSGKYKILCSVNLFLMGFTIKDCECILQARPTESLMIYLQSLGRGMMFMPGKTLINIDAVNNYTRHGLPDDAREWSLHASKKEKGKAAYKRCPDCLRPVPVSSRSCKACGYEWQLQPVERELPKEKAGKLVRIERRRNLVLEIARGAGSLRDAVRIALAGGGTGAEGAYIWCKVLNNSVDKKAT